MPECLLFDNARQIKYAARDFNENVPLRSETKFVLSTPSLYVGASLGGKYERETRALQRPIEFEHRYSKVIFGDDRVANRGGCHSS